MTTNGLPGRSATNEPADGPGPSTSPPPATCSIPSEMHELICHEVWGGNRIVRTDVLIPGFEGTIYSKPCHGPRGGDVHYLSACAAGAISRVCLADVIGHGEAVAQVSAWLHELLRRYMNRTDPSNVFQELNTRLKSADESVIATAVSLTFNARSGDVSFCYAGHPPIFHLAAGGPAWTSIALDDESPSPGRAREDHRDRHSTPDGNRTLKRADETVPRNLPLGVILDAPFDVGVQRLNPGDRLLLFSDGVTETPGSEGGLFGLRALRAILDANTGSTHHELAEHILHELYRHSGRSELDHDDTTFMVLDVLPRLGGGLMWQMVKNNVRRMMQH